MHTLLSSSSGVGILFSKVTFSSIGPFDDDDEEPSPIKCKYLLTILLHAEIPFSAAFSLCLFEVMWVL